MKNLFLICAVLASTQTKVLANSCSSLEAKYLSLYRHADAVTFYFPDDRITIACVKIEKHESRLKRIFGAPVRAVKAVSRALTYQCLFATKPAGYWLHPTEAEIPRN